MIFTFYSYKGGVGRTMALANIAEYVNAKGWDVLMIDWDLESPGLESYFPSVIQQAQENRGLLELLLLYKERLSNPPPQDEQEIPLPFGNISEYLINIPKFGNASKRGSLRLLSAGKRDGENFKAYADDINNFDWVDFYERRRGEKYFEWFRREVEKIAPIILIDSRSGVTEMSGICTLQLADVVVAFTSSNKQSIKGTKEIIEQIKSEKLQKTRKERADLNVVVVPSRVEQTELVLRNKFEHNFKKTFDRWVPINWINVQKSFWDLNIPYVPHYAFEELIAVREQREGGKRKATELVQAYEKIWDAMVDSATPAKKEELWRRRTHKNSVLVIENAPNWQNLLEEVIAIETASSCDIASSSEEAIQKIDTTNYKLIVLNINLSLRKADYKGRDVLDFLKASGRNIPVVIMVDSPGRIGSNILQRYPMVTEVLVRGSEPSHLLNTLKDITRETLHTD